MRQVRNLLVLAVAALAFAACGPSGGDDDHGGGGDDDGHGGTIDAGGGNGGFIDAGGFAIDGGTDPNNGAGCDKMDILFVVDNSLSMQEEQQALATNFPLFVQTIEDYTTAGGAKLDYRVAITTTDITYSTQTIIGTFPTPWNDGKFVTGNCTGWPAGRGYLQRGDANVSDVFSCAAKVGTDGSGLEMPLEAAKLALIDQVTASPDTNGGFLREDALLALVFLTDENDCSKPSMVIPFPAPVKPCVTLPLEPIPSYLSKFDGIKGGERARWATAVIAIPVGAGMCGGPQSSENVRLEDFKTQTGANAVFSNICSGNMAQSLKDAFDKFSIACDNIPIPQ